MTNEITDPGVPMVGSDADGPFEWTKCSNGYCVNSPHPDGTDHVDRTGTCYVDGPDGKTIVTHTYHDPWKD